MASLTVRHPRFDLADLPRRWVGGSALATHFGNAGHVFIALGEDFFIDTVKGFRDRIEDPQLRRDVNAFIGQESVHRRTHAELWGILRDRGVPVDAYARAIASVRSLERVLPAPFRLSVTAALEHYTAAFGEAFLTEDLAAAVPDEIARLLAWHGLEELEHRAVAFDVLAAVDRSYPLRVAGFAFASGLILWVPLAGTALFAAAEASQAHDDADDAPRSPELGGMAVRLLRRMGGHLAGYLRPGFHPSQMQVPPEAITWAALLEDEPAG
jgi:uncharacterized protein